MALFALSGNLIVGHTCKNDMQCTGTEFASVCNNGRCGCQSRYIWNGTNCYPGKGNMFFIPAFVQSLTPISNDDVIQFLIVVVFPYRKLS